MWFQEVSVMNNLVGGLFLIRPVYTCAKVTNAEQMFSTIIEVVRIRQNHATKIVVVS